MGILMSRVWRLLSNSEQYKICMVGLDAAGKTTILYKLHLGEVVESYPTIGSNVEEWSYRNVKFQVWDLGGQEALRPTWQTYFVNTHAVIMVVDSADPERMDAVREELHALLQSDDLRNALLLVYANKQDLKSALSAAEITEALALHAIKTHDWHIQACSAIEGRGLVEGLEWLTTRIKNAQAA